jgi:uncharacterized protein YciI
MFIINLTYQKPTASVDDFLPAHIKYLEKHYQQNDFICSGRKVPRNGGIILCQAENKAAVQRIIAEDPFQQNGIAAYEIIEFIPSKYAAAFQPFVK